MARKPPPKQHQFRPGVSGNPGGRPRGRSLVNILREIGAEEDPDTRQTRLEQLGRALYAKAINGDVAAAQFIAERTEGKVKDVLKLEGESRMPELSDGEIAKMLMNKGKQKPSAR